MRPRRYETINGAGEIGWGTFLLCMALASYSTVVLPDSMWRWRTGISWLLMLCGCLVMPFCLWASKRYVTQPRVGYVAFSWDKSRWVGMIVGMVVAAGLSVGLVFLMRSETAHLAQSQIHHSGATNPGTMSLTLKIILAGYGPLNALLYLMMNAVSIKEHRWKWLLLIPILLAPLGICYFSSRQFYRAVPTGNVIAGSGVVHLRRDYPLFVSAPLPTACPGNRMNEQLRAISELDRVIHEPGRLMIVALLAGVKECDFLFLLNETKLNKGNLSSHLVRLETAGYVEIEKTYRGKVPMTLLRLTRTGRKAFEEYRKGLMAAF